MKSLPRKVQKSHLKTLLRKLFSQHLVSKLTSHYAGVHVISTSLAFAIIRQVRSKNSCLASSNRLLYYRKNCNYKLYPFLVLD